MTVKNDAEASDIALLPEGRGRLRQFLVDFVRYGAASAVALAVDFILLMALHYGLGLNHLIAAALAFAAGFLTVYWLSITHVFADRRALPPRVEFGGFLAIGLAGLALTEVLMYLLVDIAHASILDAKVITSGLVFAFNFLARRQMIFAGVAPPAVRLPGGGD